MAKRPSNIYEVRVTSKNTAFSEAQIEQYLPLVETIWWAAEDGAITDSEYVQWVFKAFMAVKNNTLATFTPEFEAQFGRVDTNDFNIDDFQVELSAEPSSSTPTTSFPGGGALPPANNIPGINSESSLKATFEKYKTPIIAFVAMAVLVGIYFATKKSK